MAGFGVEGNNPEGVGRDKIKMLKRIQKNRKAGALLDQIRHGSGRKVVRDSQPLLGIQTTALKGYRRA